MNAQGNHFPWAYLIINSLDFEASFLNYQRINILVSPVSQLPKCGRRV